MANDRDDLRPAPDLVEDGVPATVDDPPGLSIEATEGEPPPLDHAQGVDDWGTTAAEQRIGEPAGVRDARQRPEVDDPDEEYVDLAERGAGVEDAVSAEEAAVRVEDEPEELGMSFAADPGYVSDEDR